MMGGRSVSVVSVVVAIGAVAAMSEATQVAVSPEQFSRVVRVGGCSGVLVTPDRVVTAGHCVARGLPPTHVELYSESTRGTESVRIRRCVPHPEYDGRLPQNDIALCTLERPVTDIGTVNVKSAVEVSDARPQQEVLVVSIANVGVGRAARRWSFRKGQVRRSVPLGSSALISSSACYGDSGGAVYGATSGSKARLIGIVSSADSVACAGATRVVRVAPNQRFVFHDGSSKVGEETKP